MWDVGDEPQQAITLLKWLIRRTRFRVAANERQFAFSFLHENDVDICDRCKLVAPRF